MLIFPDGKAKYLKIVFLLTGNAEFSVFNVHKEVVKMAQTKTNYETMFIVNCSVSEEEVQATVNKFKTLIENAGAVTKYTEWGKRKLQYPIDDLTEGYYVVINHEADSDFVAELSRLFNIDEKILRYLTVRV